MSVRDNVWPPWQCIVRCPGSSFLWNSDLSREDSLLFGLLIPGPEVMLVDCTNQTTVFPPGPSLRVVWKPDVIDRCLPVCPLPDLGPFPFSPSSWPGSIQFNSTNIYRALLPARCSATLEIQREIGSLAQETPGLSSLLSTLMPAAPLISKTPRGRWRAQLHCNPFLPFAMWDGSLTLLEHWFLLYKKGIYFDH